MSNASSKKFGAAVKVHESWLKHSVKMNSQIKKKYFHKAYFVGHKIKNYGTNSFITHCGLEQPQIFK